MTKEISKSQNIRLFDVFALGPFMVYLAYKYKNIKPLERGILGLSGVATIIYNYRNYIANKRKLL
jgi:hypothetical protein